MTLPLQPDIWFTLRLEKVPSSLGTTVYRLAMRPMADAGAWKEGRVVKGTGFGPIERKLSTPDGDYAIATCDVIADDSDGLIRGLLADPTTRTFTSREGALELLSEAGRAAGTTPRTLFRGRVSNIQAELGRRARIRIADTVGSHFSGFDLEQTIGVPITRLEHPNCDDKVVNRIYPIILGEHSDVGMVDANGNPADKGVLPVVDVGDYLLADDGTIVSTDIPLSFLIAPANLQASVGGTPGTTSYTYGVTAVSPYGETTQTTISVTTAADPLTTTNKVTLTWDAVSGAVEYRVYRNGYLLARLNNGETFTDPETTYDDDGSDTPSAASAPQTNTAQTDQVVDGQGAYGWGRLILKIGAAPEVHHIYASDLAAGTTPKRVRVAEDRYGTEFLVYGRTGWPHSDPFIEINGIRMGVAYARGTALEHHRSGAVTITWNGCGDDDVGDGSGETITEAFPGLQHLINEYRLKNGGVGYKTGNFGSLETYSNGVAKLKTSAFAACQALTAQWIGGRGYQIALAITEPTSLREITRRACVTFGCHFAPSNHHGQMYPVLVDDTASSTAGRLYHERLNIAKAVSQDIDHDAVETKAVYHFFWDAEAAKFRVTDQVIEDKLASEAYFEPRQRSVRQLFYTNHTATAVDSVSRHITRYKVAPRTFGWQTDLTGLEDELGAQVRVTHYDGAGGVNGDDETPFLIVGHRPNPSPPEHVILTGLDLGRILSTGFPLLGDKTTIAGNLYNKTVFGPPTSGAYELR